MPDSTTLQAAFEQAAALHRQGRLAEAGRAYGEILQQRSDHFDALHLLGLVALQSGQTQRGIALIEKAIALNADVAPAHNNLGTGLTALKRHADALASFERAIALDPEFALAHNNRGGALLELRRSAEALESCDRAIALQADMALAHNNRGSALLALRRPAEALASYDRAVALRPDFVLAHDNRANALNDLKRHRDAATAYAEVLRLDPQHPFAKGRLLHQKMLACDWSGVDELIAGIERDIASGGLVAEPFGWQGVARSQQSLQRCAELYARHEFPRHAGEVARPAPAQSGKIRIGYVSGELRDQATSHLIVGVLERHDRARFEIYGFDNGWDDGSAMRRRIDAALDGMVDIAGLDDAAAADAIAARGIDILVNLNGYFGKGRMGVFARKPAPLQVNYLGFPGTLGADYIDYIVADRHVVPPEHEKFCTEKVVCLPGSYQANDREKEISKRAFTRSECGLPPASFVFCCFNNNYKITRAMFDCWMRLLKDIKGSVLWLFKDNAEAAESLRREAGARSIGPDRLVFAPRMPLSDHLARHRLADLFLDTRPCNAHTTASDALWAGLPVLTCIGDTFTGRVAASALHAIGLPELVTVTLQDYERTAIDLATSREKLAALKQKLDDNRLTTPLFDTALYTRHLEAAYVAMQERRRAGLAPKHIEIPA